MVDVLPLITNQPTGVHQDRCQRFYLSFFLVGSTFLILGVLHRNFGANRPVMGRADIISLEKSQFLGETENLTATEKVVNEYLLKLKKEELLLSYRATDELLPSRHFLLAKEEIENSKVFNFIKQLPKGSSLHTHILGAVNVDWIIRNLTYIENICVYGDGDAFKLEKMSYSGISPVCYWKSLEQYRQEFQNNNKNFDLFLRSKLTIGSESINQNRKEIWTNFNKTLSVALDFLTYKSIFKKYIKELLSELYEDNVFYAELRGTFMNLHDVNSRFSPKDFFDTFIEAVESFRKTHPGFIGVKYIHCVYRGVDNETLRYSLKQLKYLKSLYSDFIAGFDLIGFEDESTNLAAYYDELSQVSENLKFFFNAGETLQFGGTDFNLLEAILLNSTRIGHGLALAKHPILMEKVKNQNIAIEVCPISNQVLKFISDPRIHPAIFFLANGLPVVICNDYPALWSAKGLSYDWYVVFMAMTWENQGLELLKKFAKNSIEYSAMSKDEKLKALHVWEKQWDSFMKEIMKVAME